MLLRLLALLLTAIGALAVAAFIGIGLLLMLRFWWIGVIVIVFWGLMYLLAEITGLNIEVEKAKPQHDPTDDEDQQRDGGISYGH